jgi:putative toxin-antitoxin system antitoxin component (TIGR02293 family)
MDVFDEAARLGLERIGSPLEFADAISAGLAYEALVRVLDPGLLSGQEAHQLVGDGRSLALRRRAARRLSAPESDRLVRAVRVIGRAEEALGEPEKAHRWLRRANRALGGRRPLDLLVSDVGARAVEDVLGRIAHGVYS